MGVLAASFFALCGVRLARFNVTHVPAGPFQGLPIPAGGLTLASFVIAGLPLTPLVAIAAMFFIGGLMVSSVPYCNAKTGKTKCEQNKVICHYRCGCGLLCTSSGKSFLAIALMYIASGLVRFDGAFWVLEEHEMIEEKH